MTGMRDEPDTESDDWAPRPRRTDLPVLLASVFGLVALIATVGLLWAYAEGTPVASPAPTVASAPAGAASTGSTARTPAGGPTAPPLAAPTPLSLATTTVTTAPASVAAPWVSMIAARTHLPARAVSAYADAQLAIDLTQPGCHLSWTMLAGIGTVESGNGTHGGSTLLPDGTTSITILGPALDGTHGNAAIPATTVGLRLDGDATWDHAIGPMQFIPSTWSHWGASANGGVPNPNDIDDAALTAAHYLCAAGGDLATPDGWRKAITAYNAPPAYATQVTELATTYAEESLS
jgi:hypothetical protein